MRSLAIELTERRDSVGGFASARGSPADTESTSLAALALARVEGAGAAEAVRRARAWLLARQRPSGGWTLYEDVPVVSWSGAWAALALAADDATDPAALARAGAWLVEREGRRPGLLARLLVTLAPSEEAVSHDLALRGWPWNDAAASWVEPTAASVLALRHLARRVSVPGAAERVDEGVRLLADRACEGGGWNYGNTRVLGVALEPYPDTTAMALLALQRSTGTAGAKGIAALERLLDERTSSLALALATLAFELHGHAADRARGALVERLRERPLPPDGRSLALSLLALTGGSALLEVT